MKKKNHRFFFYVWLSIIFGVISIFNSLFFLLIIPIFIILLFDKKIGSKLLIIPFIILFFCVPGIFIQYIRIDSLNKPLSIEYATTNLFFTIYNKIKYNIIESDLGNIRSVKEPIIIEDFENINPLKRYQSREYPFVKITLDSESYSGNSSIKIAFNSSSDSALLLNFYLRNNNWNSYNFVNLWIKSDDFSGMLEFILVDADGDWWHYYIQDIKKNWSLIKMPLSSFDNPVWTHHGNGKHNFENVTKYFIKIDSANDKEQSSINIDEIFLSDI